MAFIGEFTATVYPVRAGKMCGVQLTPEISEIAHEEVVLDQPSARKRICSFVFLKNFSFKNKTNEKTQAFEFRGFSRLRAGCF
jgi:hypothetical protein